MRGSKDRVSVPTKQRIPRISARKAAGILKDCDQLLADSKQVLADLPRVGFAQFLALLSEDILRLAIQPDSSGERARARLISDIVPALQGNMAERHAVSIEDIAYCSNTRAARLDITKSPLFKECVYWLDLRNTADGGQFVLGQPKNQRNRKTPGRLPTVAELFPEIVTPLLDGTDDLPTCSAVEGLERQEPFINQTLAYQGLAMLARLFRHGELTHHGGL